MSKRSSDTPRRSETSRRRTAAMPTPAPGRGEEAAANRILKIRPAQVNQALNSSSFSRCSRPQPYRQRPSPGVQWTTQASGSGGCSVPKMADRPLESSLVGQPTATTAPPRTVIGR